MKDDKISIFQMMAVYILVSIVPIVRYFPISMTDKAGKGAWIAAILAIIPGILLASVLHNLMNNLKTKGINKVENYADVLDVVYGKTIGSILSIVYLLWIILFAAIELRLFAERLISTTFVYATIEFFIVTMLVLVFFIIRGRVSNFGRFAEVFLELFLFIIIFVVITASPNITIKNFWPITTNDTVPILRGIVRGTNIFNMFTFAMFLGDKIQDKENIKKVGTKGAIVVGLIGLISVIITLGTFGKDLLPTLSQPFFMALKVINLFGVLERIESVFITFWVVADFIIIAYNVLIASNILKHKLKLTKRRIAVTPIVFIIFILALIMANNYFTLQMLFINYITVFNFIVGFILPFITFAVAKARRLL